MNNERHDHATVGDECHMYYDSENLYHRLVLRREPEPYLRIVSVAR